MEFIKHTQDSSPEKIAPAILVDSEQLLDLMYKFILDRPCLLCNRKDSIFLDSIKTHGVTCNFNFSYHSTSSKWKYKFTSGHMQGHKEEMSARLIYAFVLAGLTFEKYAEVMSLIDLNYFTQKTFLKYIEKMETVVSEIFQEELKKNQEEYAMYIIKTDAGWSHRGWSANECCVIVFDADCSQILDMEIVIRKLRRL
jgi:hypothetical protein